MKSKTYESDDDGEPTSCNKYPNQEKEHILSFKGRPFGCLDSPHFPTPTSTLMDHDLVHDLGLKMYDLRYTKITYCGAKMRILGTVHLTAQTIHDGVESGAFPMKANVVHDLEKNVDCECVAGVEMIAQLERMSGACNPSSLQSPTPRRPTSHSLRSSSPSSSPNRTSPGRPLPKPPQGRTSPPFSPPGLPTKPPYSRPPPTIQSRPKLNQECELHTLHEVDPKGHVQIGPDADNEEITTPRTHSVSAITSPSDSDTSPNASITSTTLSEIGASDNVKITPPIRSQRLVMNDLSSLTVHEAAQAANAVNSVSTDKNQATIISGNSKGGS